MAAIRRHLPLITARIRFMEEICTEHPEAAHATNFAYLEERRTSVPPRHPVAEDMTDGDSEAGASPSWIDYDDDDDVEMGGEGEDGGDHIGHRNEAGPSKVTSNNRPQRGKKIPKPVGEAGRPNSGGYNLERKLKWEKEVFEEIKVGEPRHAR